LARDEHDNGTTGYATSSPYPLTDAAIFLVATVAPGGGSEQVIRELFADVAG
jgi:hypothetical protein